MPEEPKIKRAVSFFDGQNLYRQAKDTFGYHHPNYDPQKLSAAVCAARGWVNHRLYFYTGIPNPDQNPMWHGYWTNRISAMRRTGITVVSRPLRYRAESVDLPDGSSHKITVGREKGIDLRLGLDVVRMARLGELEVAVIFSQDQDFVEVAEEVRNIAKAENRWLKVVSAFPYGSKTSANRGVDRTDWFKMDKAFYDACLDPRDYRPAVK